MNLESFTGSGSTPSRRRFWDKVTRVVIASRKIEGKNVSVDEHQGYGTLISVNPQRGGGMGACCDEENNCTITTEAGCVGTFQGIGTVCDPDPCVEVMTGGCCKDGSCSILTEGECAAITGYYLGDGTNCDGEFCGTWTCCYPLLNCLTGETYCNTGEVCGADTPDGCANAGGRPIIGSLVCDECLPPVTVCCTEALPVCCFTEELGYFCWNDETCGL